MQRWGILLNRIFLVYITGDRSGPGILEIPPSEDALYCDPDLYASAAIPQSQHAICCDAFVFDTQGQLPYIPPTKKEVLINFNDIIRTVNVVDTLTNIAILGLIILIGSFFSLILHLEIGDRWP